MTTNVIHNKALLENVSLNVKTNTGKVNLEIEIIGDVDAQITSQTTTGTDNYKHKPFDVLQSRIHSRSYSSANNFETSKYVTTGNIRINTYYHSTISIQQQISVDVIYTKSL